MDLSSAEVSCLSLAQPSCDDVHRVAPSPHFATSPAPSQGVLHHVHRRVTPGQGRWQRFPAPTPLHGHGAEAAVEDAREDGDDRVGDDRVGVGGGIAAASNGGNWATQAGGATAVGAGAFLVKSGFDKQAEARIHMQALEELGESLENAVAPQVINLDDRTITLSGSVEEQYGQWRDILADLYAAEMGEL